MPIIGSGWFSVGAFLLFNSILNYLPDAYPEYAASVLAGNDFMRSSFGAGFPLFATAMYNKLGVAWASSTLAFISVAFIPIPFVLIKVSACGFLYFVPIATMLTVANSTVLRFGVSTLSMRGKTCESLRQTWLAI